MILGERAAGLLLVMAAAAHWLLVAGLLAALVLAASHAHAGEPVCTGSNLVAEMRENEPERYEAIRDQADRTQNGQALLWRIEVTDADVAPSYLFGTMHLTDPRIVDLPDGVRSAFAESVTVVIESTEILDQAAMMGAIASDPQLTMFTDSTTLRSLVPPDALPMVEAALEARGMPLSAINKMKPWIVSSMVALPACEIDRKARGEPILDIMLAEDAVSGGKALKGLESIAEQLGAMASLPMDLHVEGLVETLRLGAQVDDLVETMVALYLAEEIGMFWPFFRAFLPSGEGGQASYVAFEEALVTARNRLMAERSRPIIEEGGAFIAIGALHLPGPDGVVALLREAGFEVTAVRR